MTQPEQQTDPNSEDMLLAARASGRIAERGLLLLLKEFDTTRANIEEDCRALRDVDLMDDERIKEMARLTAMLNHLMAQLHTLHHAAKRAAAGEPPEPTPDMGPEAFEDVGEFLRRLMADD